MPGTRSAARAAQAACAALVQLINETDPPSGTPKTLSLLAGGVAFAVALHRARKPR